MNKIRNSIENSQSRLELQTLNEESGKKSTLKAKLNAASEQEKLQKSKEHCKNLLGNSPEIIDKPTENNINSQLDIKLGRFTEEELDAVV